MEILYRNQAPAYRGCSPPPKEARSGFLGNLWCYLFGSGSAPVYRTANHGKNGSAAPAVSRCWWQAFPSTPTYKSAPPKPSPDDVRRTILGRRACFSRVRLHHVHYPHMAPLTEEQKASRPDVWHPIARRHPRSGWTALYIGRWAVEVEGLPGAEAEDLIRFLQAFAVRPEFVYRHRWRVGDAVLWDNRCTQHCATEFDDVRDRRRMHRTTLECEPPLLADPPRPRPARP